MKYMSGNEIRSRFIKFFQERGHLWLPSASLIPQDDPTLLLIGAGMAPFKPFFTGKLKPPSPRITTCQKCVRTGDIENVGHTARHHTFEGTGTAGGQTVYHDPHEGRRGLPDLA